MPTRCAVTSDMRRPAVETQRVTLAAFVVSNTCERLGVSAALKNSPHLRYTLMLNGERAPLDSDGHRCLSSGDVLLFLGPIAGG